MQQLSSLGTHVFSRSLVKAVSSRTSSAVLNSKYPCVSQKSEFAINPFTLKSDQFQFSPVALPET